MNAQTLPLTSAPLSLASAMDQAFELIRKALHTSSSQLDELALSPERQNPAVRMLSTSPRAFVMNRSGMSPNSWSPFAQDWSMQIEMLARMVRDQQLSKVRTLLEGGKVDDNEHGRVCLAPEVIQACSPLIGNLQQG